MTITNRWGLAAGLAAALALYGNASAQGGGGGAAGASPSTSTGSTDRPGASSTAGQPGSATGTRDPSATPREGTGSAAAGSSAQAGQKIDEDLKEKLEKIHASNQAEVQMAKMGQQHAQSPQVKEYAQKLEQDHQSLDQKLTQTAQSMGVSLQGKEFQKAQEKSTKDMDKLSKRTGAEFDQEFMNAMVKDHERDLKEVRAAAKDAQKGQHTELASLLQQAETGMQGHLTEAQQIHKSLEGSRQRAGGASQPGTTGTGSGAPSGGGGGRSTQPR